MSGIQKKQPEKVEIAKEDIAPLKFSLGKVKEKPKRAYRKGSKYDPIIDAFDKGTDKLCSVNVKGKDGNYLRTQLNKRLEARKLDKQIQVSVTNNVCYLEKT